MTTLSLKDAAKYVGVPPKQLHTWTWDKTGPKPVHPSKNNPIYHQAELDRWLKAQGQAPYHAPSPPKRIPDDGRRRWTV